MHKISFENYEVKYLKKWKILKEKDEGKDGKEAKDPVLAKRAILYQEVERQIYCESIKRQEQID